MTIPDIRVELHLIAERVCDPVLSLMLHFLAEETRRRKPVRRAPKQPSVLVSRAAILRYIRANPDASYMEIANHFGLPNIRQVSYILAGKRS